MQMKIQLSQICEMQQKICIVLDAYIKKARSKNQ